MNKPLTFPDGPARDLELGNVIRDSDVAIGLPADHGYGGPAKLMALYRFKVGDTVFILWDNEVTNFEIEVVEISVTARGEKVKYTRNDSEFPWYEESKCFATKEELLKSL